METTGQFHIPGVWGAGGVILYLLNRKLPGPHGWSGVFGEEKCFRLPGITQQIVKFITWVCMVQLLIKYGAEIVLFYKSRQISC